MKSDEAALWARVVTQWEWVKLLPAGEKIVYAGQIGERIGIPIKRIEYLSSKWHRQGRWVKLGSATGTDIVIA